MQILILGYSKIFQKRVLPVLQQSDFVAAIDIASASRHNEIKKDGKIRDIYNDYQKALRDSDSEIIYVTMINSAHTRWVKYALADSRHAIVDKPAFTSLRDSIDIVELARKKSRCLAEANVYPYHPQIDAAKQVFKEKKAQPEKISAIFSFPPFDNTNFRNFKELGGGAVNDLGPYAMSPGRIFFNSDPLSVYYNCVKDSNLDGLDISFSLLAVYPEGKTIVGHFGFNTEYKNCIQLLGSGVLVEIEPAYTSLPTNSHEIRIRARDQVEIREDPPADSFQLFFDDVFNSIELGKFEKFCNNLIRDARSIEKLRPEIEKKF